MTGALGILIPGFPLKNIKEIDFTHIYCVSVRNLQCPISAYCLVGKLPLRAPEGSVHLGSLSDFGLYAAPTAS